MTYGANTPNYISSKFMREAGDAMLNATGATHIRWPGGNYANMLFWNNDYGICPYFSKYADKNAAGWMWMWQEAAAFAQARGIDVLWQMNAAVGMVCGPDVAASLAAAFVRNASASGYDVRYIEVGNENYGRWEVPFPDLPQVVNASAYAATCLAVSKAVKAIDSKILVGCVGDIVDPLHANTPFSQWNSDVLIAAGHAMDFVIIHEYYVKSDADAQDRTAWGCLNYGCVSANASGGPNCGPRAVAVNANNGATQGARLPVMVTEWNMVQPFSAPTWQLLQGLFVAKHLGESMAAGIMGSTFFALANGQKPDYGMFSRDTFSQTAYAPVFAFALFTRVAPVGSTMLAIDYDESALNTTAFGFAHAQEGSYGIVLINMGSVSRTVQVAGPWQSHAIASATALTASTYTLTAAPSSGDNPFEADKFAWNGVASDNAGGPFPSAGLDSMPPTRSAWKGSVQLPPASVTGVRLAPEPLLQQ